MTTFTRALGAGALVLTLALAGCTATGGQDPAPGHGAHGASTAPSPGSSGAPTPANPSAGAPAPADTMFVTMMIPHHRQAIEMADVLLGKDGVDPRVITLAQAVKAAQQPEIDRMREWLADWGVEEPSDSGGMDHGSGMMTEADMTALASAQGAEAGRLFLEQMIRHHEGAVGMAQEALEGARIPEVRALAAQVIEDQTAEIAEMQGLLTE
ncbi:uncharacterized protein (DUF305 family) [Microbacterium resistens]|uniref:Uncharacterized protein (DUF305 family) n=1 Tax=Microbacterium resistens TaxID=156977 RepID=A0ABU1S7X7_9MICO|nr:DUF305 domain-containing protein [Microbacterium resistens]MDR6865694.1 uncharacterized protein (DUF305 family) [Microbacterium resistens]